jgi:hypothetical protein
VDPAYPATGCGIVGCRSCQPIPGIRSLPDPPAESVLSLILGTVGLLLPFVALLYLLPVSA